MNGIIKKIINENLGLISSNQSEDYLFYLDNNQKFKSGDKVSFEVNDNGKKERGFAINVILLESFSSKRKKSKYYFDDKTDALLGLNFIYEKLNYQLKYINKFKEPEKIEAQLRTSLNIIEDLIYGPVPNFNSINIDDINNFSENSEVKRTNPDYWLSNFDIEEFAQNIIEVSQIKFESGKKIDFSFVWHQWKDNNKQVFSSGYQKGYFNYSYVDKGQVEQTHVYQQPPPKTKWPIFKIEQKNYVFYIGSAPVNEIAQSSYVPSLPPKMDIEDTASRIIDSNQKPNEWQREVDTNRIRKIQQFIEDSNNIIANTPMIFIKDPSAVKVIKDKLVIDYTKFLKRHTEGELKNKFIDRKQRKNKDKAGNIVFDDYRPLWLIDGQHRIKGIHRSETQQNINVPIIIFPSNFGTTSTAKVFAEINTLQKKLNPLHELFMQHRFSIDHVNPKRKFRDYKSVSFIEAANDNWTSDWEHSRANHLSYEIAALLAKKGVLKNRIQFLTQNGSSKDILISADQWVNYSRGWFKNQCYKYKGEDVNKYIVRPELNDFKLSHREIFHFEINNYFDAWKETCNHSGWADIGHQNKWIDGVKNKALIQKKSHFIILLELYDLVRTKAENYKIAKDVKGKIQKEHFIEALKVFKWVDWTDGELLNTYGGGGEKGRRSLEAWMIDAIYAGKENTYEDIHVSNFEDNKSKAGKGINSYLDKPNISIKSSNKWPLKNKSVVLESLRPLNARSESTWSVFDEDENLIEEGKVSVRKYSLPLNATFQLKFKKEMKDLNKLIVKVEWKNAHTRTGKNKIILHRSN